MYLFPQNQSLARYEAIAGSVQREENALTNSKGYKG
jgi:hypothetical protein